MKRVSWMMYMVLCALLLCITWYCLYARCLDGPRMAATSNSKVVYDSSDRAYEYHREMPIIFIGGIPRSGTTLMRAILDAHPDIRCGEETRVIPRLLGMRAQWMRSEKEQRRLEEAGITSDVIKSAFAAFILEVIAKHGEPAPTLCNKDPFTLKSTTYLAQVFPNAKFILMIRDGRAVVHSVISRKITISGFDLKSFRQCLEKWNAGVETMYVQCVAVGPSRCMAVHYEQLVLHPRETMMKVLEFVGVDWRDSVLHHADYINVPGGISLSNVERSTDQVIKPVNAEALTRWALHVPTEVKLAIQSIAPMLSKLGYDQHAYPPYYGQPDSIVVRNTNFVKNNSNYWVEITNKLQESAKLTPQVDEHGAFKFKYVNSSVRGTVNSSKEGAGSAARWLS